MRGAIASPFRSPACQLRTRTQQESRSSLASACCQWKRILTRPGRRTRVRHPCSGETVGADDEGRSSAQAQGPGIDFTRRSSLQRSWRQGQWAACAVKGMPDSRVQQPV